MAVYGGSLDHDFVFDDWHLVVGNGVVKWPLSDAMDVFEHRPGGVSYRPVRMISYMVDHTVGGGLDARVFHRSNLIYHALTALLLYALAVQTIGRVAPALFAAAVFAVHPLGSEAVAYVSGRRDLLAGLFALGGLGAWWSFCETRTVVGRMVWLVVTILAAGLALGAKENAAVFPALALLLFVVHERRQPGASLGSPVSWAALLAGAVALWLVVDWFYLDRIWEALSRLRGDPLAPQPALTLTVLGQYAWLSVWPVHLLADYRPPGWPLPSAPLDLMSIASGAVLLAASAFGAVLVWRGRIAGAGLLWFLIALLPVAQIVPYGEIVAEHNAYLPLAGLALALGDLASGMLQRRGVPAAIACGLLVALLGARAHARTADWVDDETLWTVTLEQVPDSVRSKHNLATAFARRGRLERARDLLEQAAAQKPPDADVLETLATVVGRLGDDGRALEIAERAVQIDPSGDRLAFLGWIQLSNGAEAAAQKTFRRALKEDPRQRAARDGLEQIRERQRQRRHLRHGSSR